MATNGVGVKVEETKIVVVMVGLPARGKSLIAQKSKSRMSCPSGLPSEVEAINTVQLTGIGLKL